MRRSVLIFALAALAAPVAAQPPAVTPAPVPAPAPAPAPTPAPPTPIERPDAARFAAAQRLVAITMPHGFIRDTMAGIMPNADTILAALAERFGIETVNLSREQRVRAVEERGQTQDRHFRERLEIVLDVTTRMTGEVLDEMEPDLARVTATLIARQFSVEEIGQMANFFSTPIGQRWMRMSLTMSRDPAYQEVIALMAPRMIEAQRRIDAAVRDAVAHLDPTPQS